jgi:2-polyprenyl-3-methyl-5-hydroxy-6-metoxy-1,4-benzoquinol methylase
MKCRHCGAKLILSLIDLGSAPPSNAYLTSQAMHAAEKWLPLHVLVCEKCWLVQTEDFAQESELFDDEYSYFSSFSVDWLQHAQLYVKDMVNRFSLNESSHVVEVAANDGYLLQYVKERNIPCTGIEPTKSTATAARKKNIPIIEKFFGVELAHKLVKQGKKADLIVANNVLAHVPDINDFVSGFSILLNSNGVATFEFPHLLSLINKSYFDTIYHEHFSYLSLIALETIFKENGLQIFDVEEHRTHGGSLRVFSQNSSTGLHPITDRVIKLHNREINAGVNHSNFYKGFQDRVDVIKNDLLIFLIKAKKEKKRVVAYGAAAKGSTFLNYAGIRADLITYVVDRCPSKQNKYMPGSRIPIKGEEYLKKDHPDYVLILPWNLKKEIIEQLSYIKEQGGKIVIAVPELEII